MFTAALAPGIQLTYASFDDTVAVSTALDGVAQASAPEGEGLAGDEEFSILLDDRPAEATAVVFLDLDRLLALGDQIGLAEEAAYATAREDARGVRLQPAEEVRSVWAECVCLSGFARAPLVRVRLCGCCHGSCVPSAAS